MPDNDVEDTTQQEIDADGAATDPNASDSESELDSDAEGKPDTDGADSEGKPAVRGAKDAQFMEDLLDEYGLENAEDLKDFISNLSDVAEKLQGEDIDDLLDNKALMVRYQQQWAAKEAATLEEKETPEETIARLKKEKQEMAQDAARQRSKQAQAEEAQRLLGSFNNTVHKTIRSIKEVPKEYRNFLSLFMGVDNPINDVDLADRGKVIDLTKKSAKMLMDFEQAVIKRYLAGKAKVPAVTTTQDSTTDDKPGEIKNLRDARKTLMERIKAARSAKKK